jgi:capsular polysaccharide biosynthesis protein
MEVIPNLIFEKKIDFSDFIFLLYGKEKNMLEKVLNIMGYKNKVIKLDNLNIHVHNLFVPSFQTFGHITAPRIESIKFPQEISQKIQPSYLNEYIYVSRNDAHQRKTVNEDSIITMLQSYNFKIIVPGKFSINEQIKIFANAKYIVAPHGMGITNILFRRGDFTLVEIFPDGWTRNCYFRMTQLLNGKYRGVFLPSFNNDNDLKVDIDILKNIIEEDLSHAN